MQRVETAENISFILYLVPFLASAVYALSVWVPSGLSSTLPQTVYLTVTKDPYLFLVGFLAVCLGVLIEVYLSPADSRLNRLAANSRQIQVLALISIVSAAVSVWSVTSYSLNTRELLSILLQGRYALIYPLVLFILAIMLNPSVRFGFLSFNNLLKNASLILLIASPLILYGLWRLHVSWTGIIFSTLITLAIGLALLLYRGLGRTS